MALEITKQLLLNLSILLVLLFFFQMWSEKWWNQVPPKWIISLFFILSIVVSLLLSIKIGEHLRLDFRHIPFIIGSLYIGNRMAVLLFAITLSTRALCGINAGFWITCIVFGILTLMCIKLHKRFLKQSFKKKIILSTLLSVFHSIMVLGVIKSIGFSITTMGLWVSYVIIPAVGTGIGTYTIEVWKKNLFLRQQIIKLEKNHVISNMSAAISHEVRNPLTSIRGFLQLLKESDFDEIKRREFIDISIDELDRAQKIITDYLTFSKPNAHEVGIVDINQEINKVINLSKPLANMNTIIIEMDLNCVGGIAGDKHQFHQCMMNILKNCIEAMPRGGTLTIKTSNKQNKVDVLVMDTGVGMTEEQIQKLGEPYFSTKGTNGTGLGMMVAINIIHTMHGIIKVDSKIGRGTVFYITFSNN
jgi:two-component system, sporulation sensor kinase B